MLPLRTPKIYAECEPGGWNVARPCPFKECKYRLGSGKCVLDLVSANGPMTAKQVAEEMSTTEEAIKSLEKRAFEKLRASNLLRTLYER